jgi:hypothetical protein
MRNGSRSRIAMFSGRSRAVVCGRLDLDRVPAYLRKTVNLSK